MEAVISSKRQYKIAVCDNVGLTVECTTLNAIFDANQDYEWIFACQDIIDPLLDLKVGESLYFQPNRDE